MLIICTVNSEATNTIILVPKKQLQHLVSSVLNYVTHCGYTVRRVVFGVSLSIAISAQPRTLVNESHTPSQKGSNNTCAGTVSGHVIFTHGEAPLPTPKVAPIANARPIIP